MIRLLLSTFVLLMTAVLLSSCAELFTVEPTLPYVPQYIDFAYKLDGKVQVKHSYLFGGGVKKCAYPGELGESYMERNTLVYPYKSPVIPNFFMKNGHIYQGKANRDNVVLGSPYTSRLGGEINPETGKQKIYVTKLWEFDPLCSGWVDGFDFSFRLQKSSALSIVEEIAQTKRLLGGAWKESVRMEPEFTVKRGNNTWTVFKTWNRAIYLADASEDWYLPIGDGTFYYRVAFSYKSSLLTKAPEHYAKGRSMLDRIIDSFEIRELTAEESAAIVNPEPVDPKYSPQFKKQRQESIDRYMRDKYLREHASKNQ